MSRDTNRYLKRMARFGLVKIVDGEVMMHGAMLLFMAADAAGGSEGPGPRSKQRGQAVVDAVLNAAKAAGFAYTDDLRERLLGGMRGPNTAGLAVAAVEAIGPQEAFFEVLGRAGFQPADFHYDAPGMLQ